MVVLKVYNLLGQEVKTLINQNLPAGDHMISFDATGLSNGVYFYKLTSGKYTATKQMILIK